MRLYAVLAALLLAAPALAQPTDPHPSDPHPSDQVIHDYLMAHPEVILESVKAYEAKQEAAAGAASRQAVGSHRAELLADAASPVGGNPQGNVTVVEFFDYRCPYCRQMQGDLGKLLAGDPNIRFVYKELPILAPDSAVAARAALAAARQGKFQPFHDILMKTPGPFTKEVLRQVAAETGVDAKKMEAEMEAPDITKEIDETHRLAETLKINGTPAFVIGAAIIPGVVDLQTLQGVIAEARKGG